VAQGPASRLDSTRVAVGGRQTLCNPSPMLRNSSSHRAGATKVGGGDPFDALVAAVAARADREAADDLGTALVHHVMSLRQTAGALMPDSYRAAYERDGAGFYQALTAGLDALYQQIHAAVEASVKLVGSRAQPTMQLKNIASLESAIERQQTYPIAAAVRQIGRELRLLKWLCAVRNQAVQHRVENGYLGNRAVVLSDGYAELRKPVAEIDRGHVRKAQALLRGYVRRYGLRLDVEARSPELIAYLDLVSHSLYAESAADFDTARRVVEEAGAHDVIVSRPMIQNTAAALTCLVRLAPENPGSPFAERAGTTV
jgi:3-dehydroquinate dehydratase